MDVQMPEMDGIQATKAIREHEQEPATRNSQPATHHIPIIAMTANAMKGDLERCIEAGMDDYLSKPIRSQILQETINKYLCEVAWPSENYDLLPQNIRCKRTSWQNKELVLKGGL